MLENQLTTKRKILIGVAVVVSLALLAFVLWYMFTHPVFSGVATNISIIVLALVVLVMNIFLIFMMWQIIRLIDFLLFELKPVLESLQETSSTVRGTATFVTDEVSSPIIDASAKAARVKGSLRFVLDSLLKGGQGASRGSQGTGAPSTPPPSWGAASAENSGGPAASTADQPTA